MKSYRDLVVWQKAMDLAVLVYRLVERFPDTERYALTSQLRRSVVSVAANVAEGNGRGSLREYAQFVAIAKGSLSESETYVLLAVRLGYVTETDCTNVLSLATEISKMLTALRSRLLSSV